MLVQKSAALVLPLLLVLLATTPSAEAACTGPTINSSLAVPTGLHTPPPQALNNNNLQSTTVYIISAPTVGKFELAPVSGTAVSVVAGIYFPDFDAAWYTSGQGFIEKSADPGSDTGNIPSNAAYLVIWMAHGPDFGNSDSKFPQAAFTLQTGCS